MSAPPILKPPSPSDVELRAFINGEHVDVRGNETFALENPSTGEFFVNLKAANEADVNDAYTAAMKAQPAWGALSPSKRVSHVCAFAKLLTRDAAKLGGLETVVMGKQMSVQLGPSTEQFINDITGYASSTHGKSSNANKDMLAVSTFRPYGVVACIMPFNSPTGNLAMAVIPALLAGNAVILKPSERNALTVLAWGALFNEAGFPPGTVNILPGGGQTGALLAEHMGIRMITFTGSVSAGRAVAAAAVRSNLKKVVLELGGKSPAIVFDDADIPSAVGHISVGIRFLAGQMCIANSRIYVQESIAESFKKAFTEHHFSHKMGDPWDLSSALGSGPVVDKRAYDSILGYIESARTSGGTVLQAEQAKTKGYFIPATILTDLPEDAKAIKEEIFGNVTHISTFRTEAEALALANDTEFGLYASVFTSNTDRAIRCSQGLQAGTVLVNSGAPFLAADMPFGGVKQSGWGKQLGPHCITDFMQEQTTFIKYGAAPPE
ncbi:hypothetical protein A4X13_0g463 [Tilletia indica]|uniref:Aldehyde dehydrogenase domain-containing protein n=1 Tax=Tilletia indica TaxID=43049 RepID=A0A177TJ24_9BASI|nr:hypothetical protein A4X13_0g463 [Tilletia indica]